MTNVRGMTVKQFKDEIDNMRKIVDFKDEEAKIVNLNDLISNSNRQIDIVFERGNVTVALSTGIELEEKEW